ncbi:bifunctional 5,6,7,8-tetrahydromethanopterin hydro-lyase/3-hexulose-6-phosphate synthase [Methanospirillum sp. J.3.6.1-F.2.7.3]|jgi:bifunctional enzyme Fae/Hps|uniref:Bifunctional enzyme Fae/Hps n=1 Tax=Methanospirillum purgamenti TaxID=2834276 RepID=A0A8E7AZ70_9EURY|nr:MULTISPECIES: bifunctional 5,6,7,8-tetrahydromethanopterin hydro-lyase/3-hexulose-6-phosphate synthase [Methanospirillum]MDX8549982.1 bifunctional 5,6,7,8-tetrahydromethanopterin hydro-lyase/3-hexulose-6-phosphate synthase [Methanospirillum hungatei]NLW75963.1 bifunctional 5,6,7,8-tetrahydromethanopterin hydro-lyase/3-hexulose-6-phosphate synthase [Methanomicrobiales archaeon]QVV90110.1 bifunctional 5,6,7,8-tetrahydromethanopterin hydro-lyase/3-hexulose-6-phosphate synthase [Methanospirillum 
MYLIGEALIGEGSELAHVDLIVGDKNGPVGMAFANALSQLSAGHTPLLAVVRPNLLTKPATVVIPKVTLKHEGQVNQMFGPVQAAVAKAVADAVEEGLFGDVNINDICILASAFLHPSAKDYNRIYRYNYGATKLAISRAFEEFPDEKTLIHEKDRAAHAVMGFKVPRLWDPPYLQVALDIVDMGKLRSVLSSLPENDHLIIEAGTPLIKKFGLQVISEIRAIKPNAFIVADMKILDTGNLEARMAADSSADAVVMSGLAPASTIEKAITEARKTGIYSVIDMLNVEDPVGLIASLKVKPDIVELHRAIDAEHTSHAWGNIGDIKKAAGGKLLVATAGGIRVPVVKEALKTGADILVVGRAITASKDVRHAAEEFLEQLNKEEIDQFRIMTDF